MFLFDVVVGVIVALAVLLSSRQREGTKKSRKGGGQEVEQLPGKIKGAVMFSNVKIIVFL